MITPPTVSVPRFACVDGSENLNSNAFTCLLFMSRSPWIFSVANKWALVACLTYRTRLVYDVSATPARIINNNQAFLAILIFHLFSLSFFRREFRHTLMIVTIASNRNITGINRAIRETLNWNCLFRELIRMFSFLIKIVNDSLGKWANRRERARCVCISTASLLQGLASRTINLVLI